MACNFGSGYDTMNVWWSHIAVFVNKLYWEFLCEFSKKILKYKILVEKY